MSEFCVTRGLYVGVSLTLINFRELSDSASKVLLSLCSSSKLLFFCIITIESKKKKKPHIFW